MPYDRTPIATKATSAYSGIAIYSIDTSGMDNYAMVGRYSDLNYTNTGREKPRRHKIYFVPRRGAFFVLNRRREYLDEYMKTNELKRD